MLKGSFIRRSDSCVDNGFVNATRPSVNASGRTNAEAGSRTVVAAVLTAMLLSTLAVSGARASDKADHEQARAAVQAGEVLPLPTLLQKLQRTHPGQVLELELERDDGRWLYEVKLLQANGRLLKLELDASTGQVLKVKREKVRSGDSKSKSTNGASK
jgi:uncharacterized membrane protein YkoI